MCSLQGKRTVITGGLGLIGRAVVESLVKSGSEVIILDINENLGNEFIQQFNTLNEKVYYEQFDITKLDNIAGGIEYLEEKYGAIDSWINNALPHTEDWRNPLEKITAESWRKNVDFQLNSYCICSNEIAKRMAKRHAGAILNISSIFGVVAPDHNLYEGLDMTFPAAYSAIKGGVLSYSKYLAGYYGKHNVRVNVICPGGVFNCQPEQFVERFSKKTLLGRMAEPHEIAEPIVFLLSDSAAYITGAVLMVDGGWTAI